MTSSDLGNGFVGLPVVADPALKQLHGIGEFRAAIPSACSHARLARTAAGHAPRRPQAWHEQRLQIGQGRTSSPQRSASISTWLGAAIIRAKDEQAARAGQKN